MDDTVATTFMKKRNDSSSNYNNNSDDDESEEVRTCKVDAFERIPRQGVINQCHPQLVAVHLTLRLTGTNGPID